VEVPSLCFCLRPSVPPHEKSALKACPKLQMAVLWTHLDLLSTVLTGEVVQPRVAWKLDHLDG
jgi:hypothetical protein